MSKFAWPSKVAVPTLNRGVGFDMWGKVAPTLSRCPTILFDRRVSAREDFGRNFSGAIGVVGLVRSGVWNPGCRGHARVLEFR